MKKSPSLLFLLNLYSVQSGLQIGELSTCDTHNIEKNGPLMYSSALETTMRTKKPPSWPSAHLQPRIKFEKCVSAIPFYKDF